MTSREYGLLIAYMMAGLDMRTVKRRRECPWAMDRVRAVSDSLEEAAETEELGTVARGFLTGLAEMGREVLDAGDWRRMLEALARRATAIFDSYRKRFPPDELEAELGDAATELLSRDTPAAYAAASILISICTRLMEEIFAYEMERYIEEVVKEEGRSRKGRAGHGRGE